LRLEDRVTDLVADGVDIAVRASPQRSAGSNVIARKVGSWSNVLVAAPSYLRSHAPPQSLTALSRHRLLAHVGADQRAVVWKLSRRGKTTSVPVDGAFRTNNVLLLRDLAVQGDGIALLPEWLVAPDLSSGQLTRVLPNHEGHTTFAFLVHRPAPPPRVRVALDALAEILRTPGRLR
jgi:DNA-binding transcriptional LysR family regulator